MGCDIHGHLEAKTMGDRFHGVAEFSHMTRSYDTFTRLAGVRDRGLYQPVVTPRGLPPNPSLAVQWDYTLFVKDDKDTETGGPHSCSRSKAESWVKRGVSEWWNDDKTRVTHPDWHSVSWLTPEELREALLDTSPVDYWALVAAMEELDSRADHEPRFVFWFDN